MAGYRSQLLRVELIAEEGASLGLAAHLRTRGWARPLVLAGRTVGAGTFFRECVRALEAGGMAVSVVADLPAPALDQPIEALAARFAEARWDVIIAVGGGSTIDSAKALSLIIARGGAVREHAIHRGASGARVERREGAFLPIVAVPTTFSGSEANMNASIRSAAQVGGRGERFSLADPQLLPAITILDPAGLRTHRREVLLGSAFNALAHCIEGAYSTRHHLLGDALAQSAGGMLCGVLEAPDDIMTTPALLALQTGSVFAGALIKEVYVGMHHALCHALVSHCGLLHAQANGTMLPYTVGHNVDALARAGDGDRLRVVALTLGLGGAGSADAAALAGAIRSRLMALQAKTEIPARLAPLGVRADQIDALVDYTLRDRALDTNPVPIARADIAAIFAEAL